MQSRNKSDKDGMRACDSYMGADEDQLSFLEGFQAQKRQDRGVETLILNPSITWPLALPVFCYRFLK